MTALPLATKRDIDTRLVRCFVAVAETGTFTQAAAALMLTQQAVSNQIKALDKLLAVSLFTRSVGGVTLTAAGLQFAQHAEEILRITDAMFSELLELGNPVRVGEVRGRHMMLDVWDAHRSRFPDAAISVRDLTGDDQVNALQSGQIDLAMTRYRPLGPGLEGCLLRYDPVVAVSVLPLSEPALLTGQYCYPLVKGAFRAWEGYIHLLNDDLDLGLQEAPFDITMLEAIGRAQIRGEIPPSLALAGMQDYPGADSFSFNRFSDLQPYYPWGLYWRSGERRRHVLQFIDTARQVAADVGWLSMSTDLPTWLPKDTPDA